MLRGFVRCIVPLLIVFGSATGVAQANGSPVSVEINTIPPVSTSAGSIGNLQVFIYNQGATPVALSGLTLPVSLPAGIVFDANPEPASTCAGANASVSGTTLTLTGAMLGAGQLCFFTASIDFPTVGLYTFTVPMGAVSTDQGVSNTAASPSTISVQPPLNVTQTFTPALIMPSQTSTYTVTMANTAAGTYEIQPFQLFNSFASGFQLASPVTIVNTCGGFVIQLGMNGYELLNGDLPANATCTISATVTAPLGTYPQTLGAGAFCCGPSPPTPSTATLVVANPTPVTVTPAFAPSSIIAGTTATFSITIANTGATAFPLTGLGLANTLPAGLTIAPVPNATTTCSTGSVTAVAGASTFSLATIPLVGTLAANASCSVSVAVTAAAAGNYTDTVPASAVTASFGVTNMAAASAMLNVVTPSPVTLTKTFAPGAIIATNTSLLTLTLANTGANAIALSNLALTDSLPAGVTFAASPNAATSCPGGTAATAGTSLTLSNGTLAAGASCTLTATVTSAAAGMYTDTTAASAIGSAQGVTNAVPAAAALTVTIPPSVTIAPAFAPTGIVVSQTATLTMTIANTAAGAILLSNLGFSQALPAGITLTAAPGAATTCPGGAVTAAGGGSTLGLSGATLAAGTSCTVSAAVTGQTIGSFTLTTPAGALTSAQAVTNTAPATAALAIGAAPPIAVSAAFAAPMLAVGQTTVLTVTIANTAGGAVALTNIALPVSLPSTLAVATPSNIATTCAGGVASLSGPASFALAGGSEAGGASCTVSLNVVATANGTPTIVIPPNSVITAQSSTNLTPAQATLAVNSPTLAVTKTANLTSAIVNAGQPVGYTIAITNSGAAAETNATLVDTLTNAALVSGSVRINGATAADSVLSGTPFGTLAPATTTTITYTATVSNAVAGGAAVTNGVVISGDQPCTGSSCSATATPLSAQPPNLTATLTADGKTSETVVPNQLITFTSTITNAGGGTAEGLTFSDTLPAGLNALANSFTQSTSRRGAAAATVSGQTMSGTLGALAPGASETISFQAQVTASLSGRSIDTLAINALGLPSVLNSNGVVLQSVAPVISVAKTASAAVATTGDRVDFRVVVSGPPGVAFGTTTIVDQLPAGMLYGPGTARLNGTASEPAIAGRTLTWSLPALLGAPLTLTYGTAIGSVSPASTALTNVVNVAATTAGGATATGIGSASVAVIASAFGSCYPITGRVYADVRRSGRFEPGDRGVSGVRIDLDDGEAAVTDAQGRYNFPCVRQGMHALRLDEHSLPSGVAAYPDININAERSTMRLVHTTFDDTIIQDINFALDSNAP